MISRQQIVEEPGVVGRSLRTHDCFAMASLAARTSRDRAGFSRTLYGSNKE